MNANDHIFVRKFMEDKTSIILDDSKNYMIESRLKSVIKKFGVSSVQIYHPSYPGCTTK